VTVGDSKYETEDEDCEHECPSPEYATHPGDYNYISEGEFSLFTQNPQLLLDTTAHAVDNVRDIDHQLRYSEGDRTTEVINLRMDIHHGPLAHYELLKQCLQNDNPQTIPINCPLGLACPCFRDWRGPDPLGLKWWQQYPHDEMVITLAKAHDASQTTELPSPSVSKEAGVPIHQPAIPAAACGFEDYTTSTMSQLVDKTPRPRPTQEKPHGRSTLPSQKT
jgi:hypothetical protein